MSHSGQWKHVRLKGSLSQSRGLMLPAEEPGGSWNPSSGAGVGHCSVSLARASRGQNCRVVASFNGETDPDSFLPEAPSISGQIDCEQVCVCTRASVVCVCVCVHARISRVCVSVCMHASTVRVCVCVCVHAHIRRAWAGMDTQGCTPLLSYESPVLGPGPGMGGHSVAVEQACSQWPRDPTWLGV